MQRIGFIVFPDFHVMTFAAMSVFELVNTTLGKRHYDLQLLSETGGSVRASVGVAVETTAFGDSHFDTLIIGGGAVPTPGLLDFLRKAPQISRRIAATCIGTFTLAEAGLLDGRRVTTHWLYARELQQRFPEVKVEEDRIFMIDGTIWTSAGMTASIDLALTMIENDLDADTARSVAKSLVLHHRRAGAQSQFSALFQLEPKSDRIQSALAYARRNLHSSLSVRELAQAANLSPRQFSRAFQAETGESPARAIEKLRIEAAKLLMEQGRHPIEIIARETGFAGRERMRRAFLRAFGEPPRVIRRNARAEALS